MNEVILVGVGFLVGCILVGFACRKKISFLEKISRKYYWRWRCTNSWMYQRDAKVSIYDYLSEKGIKRIAIYGVGDACLHTLAELDKTDIEIVFLIDRSQNKKNYGYQLLHPSENVFPTVDAVIITPFQGYDGIVSNLEGKINAEFIDIKDLI